MSVEFRPSPNIARLKESATIAVASKARALKAAGVPVIDLGAGEPDFHTPGFILDAAEQAMRSGATHYTATEGIPALREAIAADANALITHGKHVTPGEVVVSNGSKQSLFNACFCCFGPGDEVLVPTPSWTSYYEMIELARATVVPVFGDPDNSLKVTADGLAQASTPRTRGIMLNSPSNPTGAVYTKQELQDILALAASRNWWVIADEIYRRISYDDIAHSVLELTDNRSRLVVINGVAKAYAMTGWRIGWSLAPAGLSRAMTALQSHTTSNASSVSQYAALAALAEREKADLAVNSMVAEFKRRRDAVLAAVHEFPGVRYVHPAGAFYLYVNVADHSPGDNDAGAAFATQLLEQEQVAVVPGGAFLTPDWVRMSYATSQHIAVEGVTRLARCLTQGQLSLSTAS